MNQILNFKRFIFEEMEKQKAMIQKKLLEEHGAVEKHYEKSEVIFENVIYLKELKILTFQSFRYMFKVIRYK